MVVRLRVWLTIGIFALTAPALAQQRPSNQEALAIQKLMQDAISRAEPSIACVLVSRSERYKEFEVPPPPSVEPGYLGSFDPRPILDRPFENDRRRELAKRLDLSDPENVPESYGSGVVVDARGLILTPFHVVRDATKIFVRLPGGRGSYANIHAADSRSDLAILKLIQPPADLQALSFGDGANVRKGQWVLALANPYTAGFRDGSPSASWGIVANLRRRPPGTPREEERLRTLHQYGTLIQLDVRLNLGCSGGALLNLDGELIGLTTAVAAVANGEASGIYALPLDANLKRIIEVLKRGEEVEYGFLGVAAAPPGFRASEGLLLTVVTPGSPADRAGLKPEDIILEVNGNPIRDTDDLFLHVGAALSGSKAKLKVQSPGSKPREVVVSLAKFAYLGPFIASSRPASVMGLRVDHASVLMQTARLRSIPFGVVVREVEAGKPAEAKFKGLVEGGRLLITQVNGVPVGSPEEFYREARKHQVLELSVADPQRPNDTPRIIRLP